MISDMLCKIKSEPKPRRCLQPKRIKLDMESGGESSAEICRGNSSSMTQGPFDVMDSIVADVIDRTACHSGSNEPRDDRHHQNQLIDHSYSAAPLVGDIVSCSNCYDKDQIILQLKQKIKTLGDCNTSQCM